MFEGTLSRSRESPRSSRAISLPAAIGLHAVALAAVVGASIWFTEEPPEPAAPVIFHAPGHPPAPPPGRSTASEIGRRRSNERPRSFTAPLTIPERITKAVRPGGVEVETFDATGEPGEPGASDGVPGGIPGATGIDRSGLSDVEPPRPGGDNRAPDLVRRIEPVYPEIARSWCSKRSSLLPERSRRCASSSPPARCSIRRPRNRSASGATVPRR